MAAFSAQPVLGALRYLTPHELPAAAQDLLDAWVSERRPTLEMRLALQSKSDYSFIEDVVADLTVLMAEDGIDGTVARAAAAEVLSNPSLAAASNYNGHTRAVHSVLMARDEKLDRPFEMLITIQVQIRLKHVPHGGVVVVPSEVVSHDVDYELVDIEGDAQLGQLLRKYVRVMHEVGPQRARRNHAHTVVVLGDLADLGTDDLPESWQEEVGFLADAFDAKVIFSKGATLPPGVPNRLMKLFVLDPYAGKLPETAEGEDSLPIVKVDGRNNDFDEVFHQFAIALKHHAPDKKTDAYTPRALAPGEQVFHRKVGNSGGGYDNFNEGSNVPCSHEKGFKRYHKAIQATKGMERRYTNFEAAWLYHCTEGGCGIYAVFVPGAALATPQTAA